MNMHHAHAHAHAHEPCTMNMHHANAHTPCTMHHAPCTMHHAPCTCHVTSKVLSFGSSPMRSLSWSISMFKALPHNHNVDFSLFESSESRKMALCFECIINTILSESSQLVTIKNTREVQVIYMQCQAFHVYQHRLRLKQSTCFHA